MNKILLSVILLFPCFIKAQENDWAKRDSLRKIIAQTNDRKEKIKAYSLLANTYFVEASFDEQKRDTLFALYDKIDIEAEKEKDEKARGIARANRLKVFGNAQLYDEVIKLAPDYLAFAEKKELWDVYFQIYPTLITSYRNTGREVEALGLAQKMYDYAKTLNNNLGMGTALFSMAPIYGHQYRFTEQEQCLREAITLLQESNVLNLLSDIYARLGTCLVAQKRYDEAVQVADEMENVIQRYEEASGARQTNAWIYRYGIYLDAYYRSEQYDKAELYCNKIDSLSNGKIKSYEQRAAILAARGQYTEALEMADKAIESARPKGKLQAMGEKMMVLIKKEGSENIEQLFVDIINALISEHQKELNSQLDEIRVQYEVDKHIIEKERNRNYFLFAFGGCFLLAIVLGIWIYYSRTILKKNRGLYRQIKEQDRLADELEAIEKQYEMSQSISSAPDVETRLLRQAQQPIASLPGNSQQRQLVSRLREFLTKDKYFATYDIDIQSIVPEMATNRTSLFEALKTVTGKTPMEFINYLRLDEAKRMLDNSDSTIEAIATNCGFNTTRTFYNQFRERYRITPAAYRKMAKLA
jgi:AraC-like DNA-binding protein